MRRGYYWQQRFGRLELVRVALPEPSVSALVRDAVRKVEGIGQRVSALEARYTPPPASRYTQPSDKGHGEQRRGSTQPLRWTQPQPGAVVSGERQMVRRS